MDGGGRRRGEEEGKEGGGGGEEGGRFISFITLTQLQGSQQKN